MIAWGVDIRVVHRALKDGAVHGASGAFIAAPQDGHAVAALETVVVAHIGKVASGHTGWQRVGVSRELLVSGKVTSGAG